MGICWMGKEEIFVDSFCSRKSTWQMQNHKMNRFSDLVSLSQTNTIQSKIFGHKNSTAHRCKIIESGEKKNDLHIEQGWRNTSTHITKYANFFKHTFHTTFFQHQWEENMPNNFKKYNFLFRKKTIQFISRPATLISSILMGLFLGPNLNTI